MPRDFLLFSLLMWVAQFTPGPDMILIIKNTLNHGRRAGWGTMAGITTGLVVHCALVMGSLAAVLQAQPGIWQGLRWVAAAYLAWVGWRLWFVKEDEPVTPPEEGNSVALPLRSQGLPRFYREGLWCNLLNVKAVFFLAGTGMAFLHPGAPAWRGLVLMGIVLAQAVVGWGAFVWLIGHPVVRRHFLRVRGVLNRVFAVLLWGLAVKMVV